MRTTKQEASVRAARWLFLVLCTCFATAFADEPARTHGVWVWHGPSIAQSAADVQALRAFCESQHITEVYLSVSEHGDMPDLGRFASVIGPLHQSHLRVEALLSSANADEPGSHRDKLLARVREVVRFSRATPKNGFDGIHLDIEPQQRAENKGAGNLRFLDGLIAAYRAVRSIAEPAHLSVNADIQNKLLKGDASQRRMLLTSLPRLTLMLYEVSRPNDGDSVEQQAAKLRDASAKFLQMAYADLDDANLATLVIAVRTADYGKNLPAMLDALDRANRANSHYQGWARHAFNDVLGTAP